MGQLGLAGGSWTSSRPGRTGAGQSHRTAGGGRCGLRRGEGLCHLMPMAPRAPSLPGLALPWDRPFSKPQFPYLCIERFGQDHL